MRRAIQSLVSRQSGLACPSTVQLMTLRPYVCADCRRYLLEGLLPGVRPRGNGGKAEPGGRIHRPQQQRLIHVSARQSKKKEKGIDWEKVEGFRRTDKCTPEAPPEELKDEGGGDGDGGGEPSLGPDRIQLRKVLLSADQFQLISKRTSTFAGLRDESDFDLPESAGTKLVDDPVLVTSAKLWGTLLDFKRRLYQDAGVRDVWNGMQRRRIDLPIRGSNSDLLWDIFLKSALRDQDFLDEIWTYIQDLDVRLGHRRSWAGIYDTIVGHFLTFDPPAARTWHYRLYPRHESYSWPDLFSVVLRRCTDVQLTLREIHATIERPAGVYAAVIPALCDMGFHSEAARWHRHLLSFDDKPANTAGANSLLRWTAKYGSLQELHQLLRSLVETGVEVAESSLLSIMIARPNKLEALRFILAPSNEVGKAAMGDQFWALVVAQTMIERVDIYRYLKAFGTGLVVGRATVEAVMKRFDLPEDKSLWLLTEIGMMFVDPATLDPRTPQPVGPAEPLPRRKPRPNITDLPHTTASLDASLAASLSAGDWASFDQALQLPSPGPLTASTHNLLLQSYINRKNIRQALHHAEYMRLSSKPITTSSLRLLIAALLPRRRRGRNPDTQVPYSEDTVLLAIGLLFSLLRSGSTHVEPVLWREIFKRLGMARRLSDLETLACGLVEWYHPDRAPGTRRRLARTTAVQAQYVEVPPRSRANPLRKLFPKQFVAAIVEWGFLTFRPWSVEHSPLVRRPPPPPPKWAEMGERAAVFTWGVNLARKLSLLGVHVEPRVVTRAVRVRLAPVFRASPVLETSGRINRMARGVNYLHLGEVVEILEEVWGGGLWDKTGWEKKECEVRGGAEEPAWDEAMRKEVLGTAVPEAKMLGRERTSANWRWRKRRLGKNE